MKKIFITIPWFQPAFRAGGPIRSIVNLVNSFSDNVQYYIFCGDTDLNDFPLDKIEKNKWVAFNEHTQVYYAGKEKRSETLVGLVEKLQPDVIFIIGIFSWHFNLVPLLFCKAPKKIISVRGMLHPGALSQKSVKKKLFLGLWTFFDWHRKAYFHATDDDESKYILQQFGEEVQVLTAANFPRRFNARSTAKVRGTLKLASVGIVSPMKNYLLVIQALKNVHAEVEYRICGPVSDAVYWQHCLDAVKELPANISVTHIGELMPSEIEAFVQDCHVFIMPSKSENFGHAFYEALSGGKPVITSQNTPWQNLDKANAGNNLALDTVAISGAIEKYAAYSQDEYNQASASAVCYANGALDINYIRQQYFEMFSCNNQTVNQTA